MRSADVLVVGGGPAGLVAAVAARRRGLSAIVLDRAEPPIDKACGEGLMPDGLACLEELGIRVPSGVGRRFVGIRYLDGEVEAVGRFPGPDGSDATGDGVHGLGLRRDELHRILVDAATAAGVELVWGTRVTRMDEARKAPAGGPADVPGTGIGTGIVVETTAGSFAGRVLVGADGLRSRVRRWAGLDAPAADPATGRFGVRRHVRLAPWSDRVDVHWGDGAEAYVTPVAADRVGVAILWSGRKAGFDELLEGFPALARRLAGASVVTRDRGCGPLLQPVRGVVGHLAGDRGGPDRLAGSVFLIGDAAGYVDAITGEGLSLAFHQAVALGDALAAGDPGCYAAACRRIRRLPDAMTRLLLAVERRPWLRRRMVRALAADPALFSRLLGLHVRTLAPRDVGLGGLGRLAWRLALA